MDARRGGVGVGDIEEVGRDERSLHGFALAGDGIGLFAGEFDVFRNFFRGGRAAEGAAEEAGDIFLKFGRRQEAFPRGLIRERGIDAGLRGSGVAFE